MYRAVVLAALLVLAGCSLPATSDGDTSGSNDIEPWAETTFVVGLDVETADSSAKYAAALRNATAYWEANAEQYLGHPVDFRVDPDAADPDLVVSIVDGIEDCGTEDHAAGCAPHVADLRTQPAPTSIRIQRGFTRNSTGLVMQHEFGHVLGLDHSDEPHAVMQSQTVLASIPQPNATEQAVPWDDPDLTVYVDDSSLSDADTQAVRAQVDHAMAYYNDGGEGTVPANVTFTRISDRSRADIVVTFPTEPACGEPPVSCSEISGVDPDQDGARERYTGVQIYISGLSNEAVGWHVGRWFGAALGAADPADLPPAFRDATFAERRSDWWN